MSGRFRAQRIGFAVEFLGQEIELAPDRVARAISARASCTWARQPVELFAHIGLRGQQRRFLRQPVLGDRRRCEQFRDLAPRACRAAPRAGPRPACRLRASGRAISSICAGQDGASLRAFRCRAPGRAHRRQGEAFKDRGIARGARRGVGHDRLVLHDHALEREEPVHPRRREPRFAGRLPGRS